MAAVSAETSRHLPLLGGIDLFAPTAKLRLMSNVLSAQPQPGGLFSDTASAHVGSGLPVSIGYNSGMRLLQRLDGVGSPAFSATPLLGLASMLNSPASQLAVSRGAVYGFPASWTEVWCLKAQARSQLYAQSSASGLGGVEVDLLRLLSGLNRQKSVTSLLS